MIVSAREFRHDIEKYLALAQREDIFVQLGDRTPLVLRRLEETEEKKYIAERVAIAKSLCGIIPADITLEEARAERLSKI